MVLFHSSHGQISTNRLYCPLDIRDIHGPSTKSVEKQAVASYITHDRASTDDKRLFERIVAFESDYNSYQILIKHEILDRN